MTNPDQGPRATRIDAHALRVLAHPLRTRLLGLLRLDGPATATQLAARLDTNSGATSYHLRKLAEVGLVEETGDGEGRKRWWRAAHDMHSWSPSDFQGDPDAEAALEWLESEHFRIFSDHARDWAAAAPGWAPEWRDATGPSDYVIDVTPEELRRLRDDIHGEQRVPADSAERRRRVLFYTHALPEEARREGRGERS
jgi:DNA-binding transcriptional ArsR family regulator